MRISCSKCGEVFSSLIIDKTLALKEVSDKLSKHIMGNKHKESFAALQQAVQITMKSLAWLLLIDEFANVPEEEEFIQNEIDRHTEIVSFALGLESEDEEVTEVMCRLCTKVIPNDEEMLNKHLKDEHKDYVNVAKEELFNVVEEEEEEVEEEEETSREGSDDSRVDKVVQIPSTS